ncbi:uncharacterized protein RCC_08891 [Ramularia collo-cygni]|uniref:Uncharacterized protein n=1 Tax=Ramularia collo-cygni TaxID=112498 RepID=A0A2D3VGB4_9PEZI|nr:uncharacterized protein RCC_08891 [Ramularia collo-cygni]CZT23181.1 uncharacterized protein RCC_08891 [Ramularia collo-cygni]
MPLEDFSGRLPVTTTFALPLTAYYIFLQGRVVVQRFTSNTVIGQDSVSPADKKLAQRPDRLLAAVRAQTNYYENVPLALILAGLVERDGGDKKVLTWVLGALCVVRLLHAEAGVMSSNYKGKGRPIGFLGTILINAGLAVWAASRMAGYWTQSDGW